MSSIIGRPNRMNTSHVGLSWRETRRARIVQAAVDFLAEHPHDDVSMDALAKAAGTGKATLYRYFDAKEELFAACLKEVVHAIGERIEAAEASEAPSFDRLEAIVSIMVDGFSRHLLPLRLITRGQAHLHEKWRSSVQEARRILVDVLRRHFERGAKRGDYRPVDTDLVPHLVMGLIRSGVTHATHRSNREIAAGVCNLITNGCAVHSTGNSRLDRQESEQADFDVIA